MCNKQPNFDKRSGLIPAIVQDFATGQVLMQAYMSRPAWEETLKSGKAVFWSTSRWELWQKGTTSGNELVVKEIFLDCDDDCILLKVEVRGDGLACHLERVSCFEPVQL